MDTHALFTGSIDVLQKSLDVRARKHEVVTSNITNADTPNFKAFELMVEEEIQKQAGLGQHLEMVRTDGSHMPDRNTADEIGVSRKMTTDAFDMREDGNTVDVEKEMSELAKNNLMYNVSAEIIGRKFQGLRNAIKGGAQ
jgi:flagellar basal-body rod protein FlgB